VSIPTGDGLESAFRHILGEAFELDTGDALGQIIYFGSWDPVFYTGCGIFGLGVLMTVVAMMTED
jgi:hypothetical protein